MDGAVHVCQTMGVCDAMRSGRYVLTFNIVKDSKAFIQISQVHLRGVRPGAGLGGDVHGGPNHDC